MEFDTMFIGGGTPSLVSPGLLSRLVNAMLSLFRWTSSPEISIEANPDSIGADFIRETVKNGINRISIGVQDLTPTGIKTLGRIHSPETAERAVRSALDAGFDSVGIDIIYGFPGQTLGRLGHTLEKAVELGPHHISCYELTLSEGTPMAQDVLCGRQMMPDEDLRADMTDMVEDRLAGSGYIQYEISNFALRGHECRHNIAYWDGSDYLGLGCSAVSYVAGERFGNITELGSYMDMISNGNNAVEWKEGADPERGFCEAVITGLRKIEGIRPDVLFEQWNISLFERKGEVVEQLVSDGFMEFCDGYLRLTRKGRRLANQVMCRLI
jgi:oxygen-independent coproporphyrinogen-3 oxidase